MHYETLCIGPVANDLGESLCWDHEAKVLHWIDAWKSVVHTYDPAGGAFRQTSFSEALAGRPIGSIACGHNGDMVGGVRGGFYRFDLATGEVQLLAPAEAGRPATNRLNDGKCDRAGRFWCASINTDHKTPSGALWCFETGLEPVLALDGLVSGNGIAFSPDSRVMYVADSFVGQVRAFDFDIVSGTISNGRPFVTTDPAQAAPDGATVDAEGCYWTALFRGSRVAQFDPHGVLMREIHLPVSHPTMCAFGGPDLDILYVTSARRFLDEDQLRGQPMAGRLFAIHGLGARGLPEAKFGR
jgi:sugar lactone lactonase YvrE